MYVGSRTLCSVWLLLVDCIIVIHSVYISIHLSKSVPLQGLSINVSESVHY